jgi:hypothetical protein
MVEIMKKTTQDVMIVWKEKFSNKQVPMNINHEITQLYSKIIL